MALCDLRQTVAGSRWIWVTEEKETAEWPPLSDDELKSCGLSGSIWIPDCGGTPRNLLLLLHGLGDTPAPFAKLARTMKLPQTAALALCAPLALPAGLEGRMWHESFEADGELIRASAFERRRLNSLKHQGRASLQALLMRLQRAGWPAHRLFLLGYAQGGTVALDFALHCGCRLGGVVSICGLLLEEYLDADEKNALLERSGAARRRETATLVLEPTLQPQRRALFELYRCALHGRGTMPPDTLKLCTLVEISMGKMPSTADEWKPVMAFFSEHLELAAPHL